MGDSGDRPLIGRGDATLPRWATEASSATWGQILRAMPRTCAMAVRLAWAASRRLTTLFVVAQLVDGVLTTFGLLATADVFTGLLQAGPTPDRLLAALPGAVVVVAALVARVLLQAGESLIGSTLQPLVVREAQDRLYRAVSDIELVAFDDADFAEQLQQAGMVGPNRIGTVLTSTGTLLGGIVSMVAAVVAAGLLHPLLAPVVVLSALPQAWATARSARERFGSFTRMVSDQRRLGVISRLITSRQVAAEVRAFRVQERLLAEFRAMNAKLAREQVRLARVQAGIRLVGQAISGVGSGVSYLVLGLLLYAGLMDLALGGAAVVAMRAAAGAVSGAIHTANMIYEATYFVDLYRGCLAEAAVRTRPPGTVALRGDPDVVTLNDATFRYPGQDDYAVDGVSATLRRGQVVALVGENGSGKSTLAKLITGLYLPESGTVAWDGVSTTDIDAHELHDRVAVVLQDPVQWPATAENNVRIGRLSRPDPGGTALAGAAARSGADAVVDELPEGWATMLTREFQGGRDLSGGQWQRVSVARGLYRDAPVVIADEPTAALDARAEHAVFAALRGLGGTDRITVLVTHRLANVRHADQILVMEHGRLVERGTHAQLMARRGVYHELFAIQATAYGQEGPANVSDHE